MSKSTTTPEQRQILMNMSAALPFIMVALIAAVYFTHWYANYAIALVCVTAVAYLTPIEASMSAWKRVLRFTFISLETVLALAGSVSFVVPALAHWFPSAIVGYGIICFISSLSSLATEDNAKWFRTVTVALYLIMTLLAFSGQYHLFVIFETWFCVGSIGFVALLLPIALYALKKEDEKNQVGH